MVPQDIHQKLPCCIDHNQNMLIFEPFHDIHIHGIRHGGWNAARKHQHVSVSQLIQQPHQFFNLFGGDSGSHAVDFRALNGAELHVDAGNTGFNRDEFRQAADSFHTPANFLSRKACDKTERRGLQTEVIQDNRNIDALSTGKDLLEGRPVCHAELEVIYRNNIIQRWIKRYCVNHVLSPFVFLDYSI